MIAVCEAWAKDFYPRSPCGERPAAALPTRSVPNFYPRSPCGERPALDAEIAAHTVFLSTLSLRRATLYFPVCRADQHDFYPRSPCGERRRWCCTLSACRRFLSTLSLRRATPLTCGCAATSWNFYPRSPCGERQCRMVTDGQRFWISIHALLAESDKSRRSRRPPGRISIHALLAESDAKLHLTKMGRLAFLSTLSLRRATAVSLVFFELFPGFLSTLSLRRATKAA